MILFVVNLSEKNFSPHKMSSFCLINQVLFNADSYPTPMARGMRKQIGLGTDFLKH